ncbi:hypothetical protein GCM10020219_092100 [Nonomuraea dietziae]
MSARRRGRHHTPHPRVVHCTLHRSSPAPADASAVSPVRRSADGLRVVLLSYGVGYEACALVPLPDDLVIRVRSPVTASYSELSGSLVLSHASLDRYRMTPDV